MHTRIYRPNEYTFVYKPDKCPRNSSLMKCEKVMQNSAPILLCDIPGCITNAYSPIIGALYACLAKQEHGHTTARSWTQGTSEVERQRSPSLES